MSANEHIRRTAERFLDGELSAEELRELQAAMVADPRLENELQRMRDCGKRS